MVVLDLGEALTKVGFAGDAHPTHIYRTVLRVPATGALLSLTSTTAASTGVADAASLTADEWCNVLTALLRRVYFERLLVNPRDRRVLVCDHPLWPRAFRAGLVRALFALDAPAVKMAPALALPIYCTVHLPAAATAATVAPASASSPAPATSASASASAASPATAAANSAFAAASSGNGLIVDIGSSESRVLPVCDGFALHELLTCGPCGVRAVVDHFVFLAGRTHLESATDGSSAASASSASASAASSDSSAPSSSAAAETAAADRLSHLLRLAANRELGLRGTNSSSSSDSSSDSSSNTSSSSASSASPFAALTAAEAEDAVARFCFVQSRSAPIGTKCIEKAHYLT